MNNKEILDKIKNGFEFYGYMYGTPYDYYGNLGYKPAEIIKMNMSKEAIERNITKDKSAFYYVWGWPGPDFNRYAFEDYGITWAFTKEEIKPISLEDWELRKNALDT